MCVEGVVLVGTYQRASFWTSGSGLNRAKSKHVPESNVLFNGDLSARFSSGDHTTVMICRCYRMRPAASVIYYTFQWYIYRTQSPSR